MMLTVQCFPILSLAQPQPLALAILRPIERFYDDHQVSIIVVAVLLLLLILGILFYQAFLAESGTTRSYTRTPSPRPKPATPTYEPTPPRRNVTNELSTQSNSYVPPPPSSPPPPPPPVARPKRREPVQQSPPPSDSRSGRSSLSSLSSRSGPSNKSWWSRRR